MVRSPIRVLRVVLALGVPGALLAACGGSSTTKTFTLPVQQNDTVGTLYTRAITTAVQYCVDNSKLHQVRWVFGKGDIDKPIVQQYTNPHQQPGPMSIPCDQVRGQKIDPSQLTTTTTTAVASPTTDTSEDGPSSQQQDEGGKGAPGAASSTTAGGSGGGATSTPSSTTAKP